MMKAMKSLPCKSCKAECCGPVPMTSWRLEKIKAYIAALPEKERLRLARQKRRALDCGLLDVKKHCCSVYPVRPWICRAFGSMENLRCPKATEVMPLLPISETDLGYALEYETEPVLLSVGFDWGNHDKKSKRTR